MTVAGARVVVDVEVLVVVLVDVEVIEVVDVEVVVVVDVVVVVMVEVDVEVLVEVVVRVVDVVVVLYLKQKLHVESSSTLSLYVKHSSQAVHTNPKRLQYWRTGQESLFILEEQDCRRTDGQLPSMGVFPLLHKSMIWQ